MYHSPRSFLQHILAEIDYLIQAAGRTDREEFLRDETLKRAFARSLGIIGEATKHLTSDFRERHREVDWRS